MTLGDKKYACIAPEILLERMQEDALARALSQAMETLPPVPTLAGFGAYPIMITLGEWRGADEPLDYRPMPYEQAVKVIEHGG